jgi:membrane protein implicated in regulation of membrane protease activity
MFGFKGRYFPVDFILVALFACSAIWLSIRWHRSRQRESDPYKSRIRQAAKFGWKQTVEVPEDGFGAAWTQRSMRFCSWQ